MTSASCRSSSRGLRRATTWCRAAGCSRAADGCCLVRCRALHRWFGNPMFSRSRAVVPARPCTTSTAACAASRKIVSTELDQRCTGMEFATEMIIKASLVRRANREVPITLHPDGRTSHPPHLKTFRDGWRTLRFFLMCTAAKQLFLCPAWC